MGWGERGPTSGDGVEVEGKDAPSEREREREISGTMLIKKAVHRRNNAQIPGTSLPGM